MKRLVTLAAVLMCVCCVQAAAVFAHFMVSNSVNYSIATWKTDINLAQEAHLDAFALNIAYGDDSTTNYIDLAFQAAEATGFKLFLSFDYAGGVSAWPATEVSSIASRYTSSSSYYHYNGQPMISTFEGPVNADDWTALKKELGCFFIPDWSSLGAKAAADLGVADGLFSWDAWAWGDKSMNTYVDASYVDYLNGAPYMMPASPWFYTNLPGYNKNWLWRGDNAWYDRWVQIWWYKPEFVEIITWNDYGESHYIGPIYDNAMELFTTGKAPFNYATNMPHDGWRLFLPFVIDTYKFGTATITQEGVVGWYRLSEAKACSSHFTSGNTASQLQIEFEPYDIVEDAIFFTALLGSAADISVSVGGVALRASWTYEPFGSVGLYHGSVSFSGHTGIVIVSVTRGGVTVASFTGEAIGTQNCITGNTNFNAWVGSATSGATISATPPTPLSDMVCRNGTGSNNFAGLCENACEYGVYCPPTACVCLQLGPSLVSSALPKQTNPQGYPLAGEDSSYGGLCAYNCEIGFCPDTACGTVVAPLITPTVSDFSNPACQGGVGAGGDENLGGLCGFACPYGFCPAVACSCTASGGLPAQPPATPTVTGVPVLGVSEPTYSALCSYACEHGYCPGACTTAGEATPTGTGTGPGDTNSVVYIDPEIWNSADPTINCEPPCTFVLPPWTLSTTTTINIDPLTQTFEDTWPITSDGLIEYTTVTMVTVITFPAIVTTMIPVSNIIWDPVGGSSSVADIYSSFDVPGVTMTEGPGPNGQPGITYVYSYGPYPSPTSTSTTAGGVPPTGPPGHPSRVTITKGSPSPTCPFPDACHGHPCKGSHCTNGLHPLSLITLPCLGLGCNNNNNNNNNNNGNINNTGKQSYMNADSSNNLVGISGVDSTIVSQPLNQKQQVGGQNSQLLHSLGSHMAGGIRSSLQQKAYGFQNGSINNVGMMNNNNLQMMNGSYVNSQKPHFDSNQQQMSSHGGRTVDSLNSGNFYGGTTSRNMNPVSLQALHKTSSPLMKNQSNLKNTEQKMDFQGQQPLHLQQQMLQIQQNQRLSFGKSQMISDSGGQIKSEPGMESENEGLQAQVNEQFQSSMATNKLPMAETSQQMLQHQFDVDSPNEPEGQWDSNSRLGNMSYDPNFQEEFHQRITGQDEAQRNNLSSEASGNNSRAMGDSNLELQYEKQQRWLLFLRHARKCVHPPGKCPEPNCITAQKLWNHMASCKDLVRCRFPRCRVTKHLLHHHWNCRDPTCPVCVPVKRFVQLKTGIRTDSNSNSGLPPDHHSDHAGIHAMKMSPSVVETSEALHPPMKRIKIEPPSESLPTGIDNSNVPIPISNTLEALKDAPVEEHQAVIPIKSEVKTDLPATSVQKSESIQSVEFVKTEKEVESETCGVTKSGKPKIKGVSMMELFTPEQIREHIAGLRQWVGQSKAKVEKHQAMESSVNENACQLCAVEKLSFEPPPIYCTPCGARIKRNAMFYTIGTGDTRHYFCIPCYNETRGETINVDGTNILKSRMEKKKNDEETEEWWVQCDKCEGWQHQICALFNGKRNDGGEAEYTCPNCYIEEVEKGERIPLPQSSVLGAKDLPRTILSDHIENRLFKRLKQERMERARFHGRTYDEVPGAESLVVRVVSSVDKKLEVKQRFVEMFEDENYPKEFGYKSKVVLLFQKIEGVEVCLFGMYVQEFGTESQNPNHRRVYLSYLDSVKYFRPDIKTVTGEALRTFVYHEILIGYLEYCKLRGFTSCYIWACPPLKGEDYILYCHPEIQKTPKSDKLREWYVAMLRKAMKENIVAELTNLYDHFFISSGECKAKVTATRLPYFDGDYWPGAAEDIIYKLGQEEDGRKLNKKGPIKVKKPITKRGLKASGQTDLSKDLLLMHRLGELISPMKEDFIMVHLQPACTHCCVLMVSGKRWVCHQCKNFRLCDRCHEMEQKLDEREKHPINHREKHALYPIEINGVPTDTKDKDEILESEFFDTRQAFLSLCQGNHYQYDTLRRAKHSSMMVLYHLHNPTAPAFVTSCNKCHLDIETGQGWRCELCPDFDVCNACYVGIDHPHNLTNHPSIAERDGQNKEARQQRVLQLRKMLDLLVHAAQCGSALCQYPNCRKVKGLFRHGINCKTRASGGCLLCNRMWYLLRLHARACKESQCHVPRCRDLNEHLRRLQQQSDSRRRVAVMEMMRQRAAEVASST